MKSKRYEKKFFTELVKNSNNLTEIAEKLGLNPYCGNRNTIKKYINKYNIDTSHFRLRYELRKTKSKPITEILTSGSTYNTTNLKYRLYKEGLKEPICEKCGQNEWWYGEKMSLILDHINGISDDHRLENLRIVCPNCNATLPTHSGKNIKYKPKKIINNCLICGKNIDKDANYCQNCYRIISRKVKRPPYEQLIQEVRELGYSATGRKYGVSDNSIRKWIKFYEKY